MKSRLWFLVVLVSIPAVVLSGWLIFQSYRNERRAMERHLTDTVRAYSSLLDAEFRERMAVLQSLAMSTRLSTGDMAGFRVLAQRLVMRPGEWVVLAEADGREVLNTKAVRYGEMAPLEITAELRATLERRQPYISNLVTLSKEPEHLVFVAFNVTIGGDRPGILFYVITTEALSRSLLRNRLMHDGVVAVNDREKTVVVRSRSPEKFVGAKASTNVQRASRERFEGVVDSTTLDGNPSIAAFSVTDLCGYTVVVAGHKSDLLDPAKQLLIIALVVTGLAGLTVGGIVIWSNRVMEAVVTALVVDTQAVARGERVDPRKTGLIEADMVSEAMAQTSRELAARQAALAQARDEAVAASRAKDEFLAALSHELRTPLNPVLLLASDAARDPALKDDVRETFAIIEKNVLHEARLIDDLLDVTRIGSGKLSLRMESLDLHPVLLDATEAMRARAGEKKIALDLKLARGPAPVRGDGVRLLQVLTNVIGNAVKFTPVGGQVAIETKVNAPRREVAVEVTDSGIGMRPEEVARVFDRFVQGDHAKTGRGSPFGGLGLGLAIAKSLTEMHGGRIEASSDGPGRGSVFRIRLPLDQA